MFKRVEKRRLKKQEEEELGLDEDMKDVLGMHDTDSDESDTDSDDTSSGEHSEGEDGEEEQEEFGSDAEGSQEEDARSESDAEEEPVITIREALRDPVYVVSLQPIVKACIVCPGKLLKGVQMIDLHRKSNACMIFFPSYMRLDLRSISGARTTGQTVRKASYGHQPDR